MSRKTDTVVARTIGIDTGKNTLHLIGLDDRGAIVLREKLTRGRIAARLANVPQCLIEIEAGMATHCVARELIALGHDVKQVPSVYAKPFRQGHKNDFRDAHAIEEPCEGAAASAHRLSQMIKMIPPSDSRGPPAIDGGGKTRRRNFSPRPQFLSPFTAQIHSLADKFCDISESRPPNPTGGSEKVISCA